MRRGRSASAERSCASREAHAGARADCEQYPDRRSVMATVDSEPRARQGRRRRVNLRSDTAERFRDDLRACLHVERWVDEVADAAPYHSVDELLAAASDAASTLSPAEVDEALAAHPRIGEKPTGEGAAQRFSRSEQSSADAGDAELAAVIEAGNRAYEERFGRVFLIRAAGRTRAEIFAELSRRMELDDAAELEVVGEQLREITLLRLRAMFADAAGPIGATA